MNISERIEYDIEEINKYFSIVKQAIGSNPEWSYLNSNASYNAAIELYGLVEFWLKAICNFQKEKLSLGLSYKDIRADNDLSAYNKYLKMVAKIDTQNHSVSYEALQSLRKVRNCIIHSGAHDSKGELKGIQNISSHGSLIIISEEFINSAITSAKMYLQGVANA